MPTAAFADYVTVSTASSPSYFQTFSSQGVWTGIGTPQHYIEETGQPVFCVQTSKGEPHGAGYSTVDGSQIFDTWAVRNGLRIIMENGYPSTTGGFSEDEARYATANAIRFFLLDCGEPNIPKWMDLNLYSQFFRAAPGYEDLWYWCLHLRDLANNQQSSSKNSSVSFSSSNLTLTEDGEYFTGTVRVTTTNCEGGYTLDSSSLPFGSRVDGYSGYNGDELHISIPSSYEQQSFTLRATGQGFGETGDIEFYSPYNSSLQVVTTYVSYTPTEFQNVANTSMTVNTPKASVKTAALRMYKTDAETAAPLSGAEFTVYDSYGNYLRSGTTDSSGYVTFSDLPLGTYYYQETSAPSGYVLDSNRYSATLDTPGYVTAANIRNQPLKSSLKIVKTDGETGSPLSGVAYVLYDSEGNYITEKYTDSNGELVFEGLSVGQYSYQEFKAPAGYELDESIYPVQITERGTTVTENRTNARQRTGTVVITKQDSLGNALSGAEYLLEYSTDGGSSWTAAAGRAVTGDDGTASFTDLMADGNTQYRLIETKSPNNLSLLTEPVYLGTLPIAVESEHLMEDAVIKDGVNYCYTSYVTVKNHEAFHLPNTGGDGYWNIALAIIVLCIAMYIYSTRNGEISEKN